MEVQLEPVLCKGWQQFICLSLFAFCPWLKTKGGEDVKAVLPLSLPFPAHPVGGVPNVDSPRAFLVAMLKEVRWCHAGQVTLCAEPSCHWAEPVPQDFQSVIIILMTCIALLAMSSLVCAKANEQCPNCKINWKTFWLKTTLTTLSFHSSFTDRCSSLLVVLSPFLLYQHAPDITLFFTWNLFFSMICFVRAFQIVTFPCARPPYASLPILFFVFSHQTPSCAAVSCIFSSRLHYCLFLQLHCVCLCICMQWGTYKRTCSFLFTAPRLP